MWNLYNKGMRGRMDLVATPFVPSGWNLEWRTTSTPGRFMHMFGPNTPTPTVRGLKMAVLRSVQCKQFTSGKISIKKLKAPLKMVGQVRSEQITDLTQMSSGRSMCKADFPWYGPLTVWAETWHGGGNPPKEVNDNIWPGYLYPWGRGPPKNGVVGFGG